MARHFSSRSRRDKLRAFADNRPDAAGKRAVQLLLKRIAGSSERSARVEHRPLPLIIRKSTVADQ